MEYLVLARKWRPQVFEDVLGQEHVVKTLKNAIRLGRVAHAYLFSGPRGVGKTSVARILAKALNCEKGPIEIPCNACVNCREITEGTSMDVNEIDGASNRGIDEIRELRENVKFAPASSRYKVYIIDEVHMLTREAFNALLKTLEEPPAHVIFVFATTETQKVPATILSRCQRFDFRRLSLKHITGNLRQIASSEGIQISDGGLALIAEASEGSVRDAQSIFDQAISYAGTPIGDSDVEELLGAADRRFLFSLSDAVLAGDAGACLRVIEEAYFAGLDMKVFYGMLLNHFRNLLLVRITAADPAVMDLLPDDVARLSQQAEKASADTLQRLMDILLDEEEAVRRSLDARLNLEFTLVRMARLQPRIPVDEILAKMEELERRLSQKSGNRPLPSRTETDPSPAKPPLAKEAAGEPATAERAGPVSEENLWESFKEFVKKKSYPIWSKIEPGRFLGYEERTFRIGFPEGYLFLDYFKEQEHKARLTEIAGEFFREDVAVKIESLKTANPGTGDHDAGHPAASNNRTGDIRREALNHPVLQKVMDVFEGAEVREVIVRNNHT
ncbi:MAG TPA: DNA polymerase III subunit gamma/tau [Syntrophales bacterium]|nr:DNA polymerase III subunit gamma/tau [Syntrophales bacterium]HOX94108.1 DNA polymerase III subunit gamma/tau [Syntrophales bacterium]HPI55957.1 DNA polymerase III subunit gamma/tau [Syntrophales bacterium]HPN24153.1 DNA polymerase III subunit gamma/tau [Syntrophales bacterium]HQM28432.1 DNA polymerase III subunit gamma/tau [Syntrophales bacterium]